MSLPILTGYSEVYLYPEDSLLYVGTTVRDRVILGFIEKKRRRLGRTGAEPDRERPLTSSPCYFAILLFRDLHALRHLE